MCENSEEFFIYILTSFTVPRLAEVCYGLILIAEYPHLLITKLLRWPH